MSVNKTGYVFEEAYMWHDPGSMSFDPWIEPCEHWENSSTKRRIHNLLTRSGILGNVTRIKARTATEEELLYFHTEGYVKKVKTLSEQGGGSAGEETTFSHGMRGSFDGSSNAYFFYVVG